MVCENPVKVADVSLSQATLLINIAQRNISYCCVMWGENGWYLFKGGISCLNVSNDALVKIPCPHFLYEDSVWGKIDSSSGTKQYSFI